MANRSQITESTSQIALQTSSSDVTVGEYESMSKSGYQLDKPYFYTGCGTYVMGSLDSTTITCSPNQIPMMGAGYNIYIFHENPSVYSEVFSSDDNGVIDTKIKVPYNATYYILVEAKKFGDNDSINLYAGAYGGGFHTLEYSYCSTPVASPSTNPGSYKYNPYNMFTTRLRSCDSEREADPMLYLKALKDGKTVVIDHNDDNWKPSELEYWGKNARIYTSFDLNNSSHELVLTSNYVLGSVPDTCDLYYNYRNQVPVANSITPSFYGYDDTGFSYYEEDIMESGLNEHLQANCVSLTVGYPDDLVWPATGQKNLEFFQKLYNNEVVETSFGYFKRADNAIKYVLDTSETAWDNSVIDLYGRVIDSTTMSYNYTHVAIRNNSDGAPHGYDWESRLGQYALQVYHARGTLINSVYGDIRHHFVVAPEETTAATTYNTMQPEEYTQVILDSLLLTANEEQLLTLAKQGISASNIIKFNNYYDDWTDLGVAQIYMSYQLGDYKSAEYNNLYALVKSIPNGELLLYEKFLAGSEVAPLIIKEFAEDEENNRYELWREIVFAPLEDNIIKTSRYNITNFIKAVIESTYNTTLVEVTDGVIDINDNITITTSSTQIDISYTVLSTSNVSISILKYGNSYIDLVIPEREITPGTYNIEYGVTSGIYIISYTLNGTTGTRKIVVN